MLQISLHFDANTILMPLSKPGLSFMAIMPPRCTEIKNSKMRRKLLRIATCNLPVQLKPLLPHTYKGNLSRVSLMEPLRQCRSMHGSGADPELAGRTMRTKEMKQTRKGRDESTRRDPSHHHAAALLLLPAHHPAHDFLMGFVLTSIV